MKHRLLNIIKSKLHLLLTAAAVLCVSQEVMADVTGVWIAGNESPFPSMSGSWDQIDVTPKAYELSANSSYHFQLSRSDGRYCAEVTINGSTGDDGQQYNKYNNNYKNTTLNTTSAGKYLFEICGYSGTNPKLRITYLSGYYVSGNGNSGSYGGWCGGKSWSPAGSQMTSLGDNLYSITFTGVTASSGLKFKVTDGSWDTTYGGDNILSASCTPSTMQSKVTKDGDGNVSLDTSGTSYTIITIKFNSSTKKIWVEFAETPKFKAGQILWMNITENWGNSDIIYVDFNSGTNNESYNSTYHKEMTLVAQKGNNDKLYVYEVTSTDEALNKQTLRFRRGTSSQLWNYTDELSASDVVAGRNNGCTTSGWGGSTQLFSPTLTTPTLTMKSSTDVAISSCYAGDAVKFSTTIPEIKLGSTSKGSLEIPLYNYSFTEGSYSSGQTEDNPKQWTTGNGNIGEGTASVSISFAVNSSKKSSSSTSPSYSTSDDDEFTINAACTDAPVIGTQPANTEVCIGGSASLTIAATITVGTPTYQWYTCNSDGSGESSIGSATGTSYTLPTSTAGTYYYKCKATGCGKTTTSRVATVTVDATSVAGSISALANPICSGTETTLRIPNGNTGSITQWQYYNTASSQWTNLGTSATQATGNLTAATQYKAFVKNGVCDAVPSSTYIVNLKTAPSKPSISGNEIMCGPSESGAYTYTSTDVSADRYNWTVTGATLYSGDGTRNITVTAGDVDNSPVTIAVTAVNCPNNTPLSTAADNYSATIYKSASAGTVSLSKSSVCVNESGITASRSDTWYTGGGSFEWSSANTTYATVSDASDPSPTITAKEPTSPTVSITCTITSPTCGSSVNSSAALTINGPAAFTINQDPASPKPWEVVTLSTSTSASANWSITSNPSGKAYLNTTSGSSTKLKAPYDASANTVKASITSGGCTQEATKSVSIGSEACN